MPVIPDHFINPPDQYPQDLSPEEVRGRYRVLLGDFQQPSVPLNLRVTEEVLLPGDIVRQRVEYGVAPGEIVPAYHLFQKNLPDNAPGILSIHAHGGDQIFPHGKAFHCHADPLDPCQHSYRCALSGFRVLAPDALCFGERQRPWGYAQMFHDEVIAHSELVGRGKSLGWKSVWDNSRAIEVLESMGCRSIGSIGWSGGSIQNYLLTPVNKKIEAAVCFFSFVTLRHQFYQYKLCHCLYPYIPGMMQAGIDWDQVVALAAPRKFFFGWAPKDEGTPEVMYRSFVDAIETRCQKEGLPRSVFVHEEEDGGHELTEAMLSNAIRFLQENVKT